MNETIKEKHIILRNPEIIKNFNEIKYFYIQKNIKYTDEKLVSMLLRRLKCNMKKKIN